MRSKAIIVAGVATAVAGGGFGSTAVGQSSHKNGKLRTITDPVDTEAGEPISKRCDIVKATAQYRDGRMVHKITTRANYPKNEGVLVIDTGGPAGPEVSIQRSKLVGLNSSATIRDGAKARFSTKGRTATITFKPRDITKKSSYKWAAVIYCDGIASDQAPGGRVLGSSNPSRYATQKTKR